ncbi:MAG: hypothetical protein ACC655_08875 [Rhodothermia bacterium]
MMIQRILASCVFVLAGMTWAVTAAAQDEDIGDWKHSSWHMTLNLDTPNLVPPAVQWTILDKDPVPGFRARLKKMRAYYQKQLERADNEAKKEVIRSSQMIVSWNLGFKAVTGNEVYLLTSAPGVSHSLSSNNPDGKKWIATKIVRITGKPVCWCIPVKVKIGERTQVSLTEENMFDWELAFDKTMRGSSHSE